MLIPSPGEWTFKSEDVAKGFDSHVREQLPWYELATEAVTHIARHYIPEGGMMYDIGASTGNVTRSMKSTLEHRKAKAVSIEQSAEMAEIFNGYGELSVGDATEYEYKSFDVAVLFLTLMFVPVQKRQQLINTLVSRCNKGGAIIVVDKCIPSGGYISTVLYRLTLEGKRKNGASAEDIVNKELSLSGVQIPIDPKTLGESTEFMRYGDFAGYVIEP